MSVANGIKYECEVTDNRNICTEHASSGRPGGLTTRWLVTWAHGLENAVFLDPDLLG